VTQGSSSPSSCTRTATRPTWSSSATPGSSPTPSSPRPRPGELRRRGRDRPARGLGLRHRRCPRRTGRRRTHRDHPAVATAARDRGRVHRHRELPERAHGADRPTRKAIFGARCRGCPFRARCTTSAGGKKLALHPHDALQRQHRARAQDSLFQAVYREHRPMVERSIAWLVAGGNRRLRFRGTRSKDLWLHHRVAGLNLRRLLNLGLTRTAEPGRRPEPPAGPALTGRPGALHAGLPWSGPIRGRHPRVPTHPPHRRPLRGPARPPTHLRMPLVQGSSRDRFRWWRRGESNP
jgi:hypothetical protein